MELSDADLLGRWLSDSDSDAFAEIVSRHGGMVFGTCARVLGAPFEAEDVAQDCFVRLCAIERLKGPSLGGLLHTMAARLSLNRLRGEARRRQRERAFIGQEDSASAAAWDDLRPHVDEAMAGLPEKFRHPIVSRFLEGRTYEALARSLGIDESTVRYRVKKGIGLVRRALRRKGIAVGAGALASMLDAQLSQAAGMPAGLKAALGKLAVAGRPEAVVGMAAAGGAASSLSTLATIGAVIMGKKAVLVCGAVIVGAAAIVAVSSREASTPEPREAQPLSTSSGISAPGSEKTADVGQVEGELSAGHQIEAKALAAALVAILEAGGSKAEGPAPHTSEDIPLDNGAHYFLLAAELLPDVDLRALYERWRELEAEGFPDDPEFWALLDQFKAAFDAIRKGLDVGHVLMPPIETPGGSMPQLAAFRNLARVLGMQARYCAARGYVEAGLEDQVTVMRFAGESSRGGVLVDGLVGFAIERSAAQSLREMLAEEAVGPADLRAVIHEMQALDAGMNTAREMMASEAGQVNSWIDASLRAGVDLRSELGDVSGETDQQLEAFFREAFQDYGAIVEYMALPYYESQAVDLAALLNNNPFGYILRESIASIPVQEAAAHAEVRGTMLVAALNLCGMEHGLYPAALAGLVPGVLASLPEDPFTGESFGYTLSDSGFSLWSAGPDMRDDGGPRWTPAVRSG